MDGQTTNKQSSESEDRFKLLFENAPLGYQSLDREGHFIEVNEKWSEILGYSTGEVIGKWFGDFLDKNYVEGFKKRFQLFKSQGKIHSEFEMVKKDGSNIFVAFDGRIGYTPSGEFKQTHCILNDITERRQAEIKLKESEEKYRSLVELSSDAIFINQKGRITYLNRSALKLFGATDPEQIIGKSPLELFHPDFHEIVGRRMEKMFAKETTVPLLEEKVIRLNGEVVEVEVAGISFELKGELAIQIVLRDISERKRIEAALVASGKEFRLLAEAMPQIVWITRADGWCIYFNQKWSDYTGLTQEESYGLNWDTPFHPDDKQRAWDTWHNTINSFGDFSIECRLRRKDGVYRWWLIRGVPIWDEQGKISKWFGTCTDIEEIKQVEEQNREQIDELRRWYVATLDREDRIQELKKEVNDLLVRLGEKPRYGAETPS